MDHELEKKLHSAVETWVRAQESRAAIILTGDKNGSHRSLLGNTESMIEFFTNALNADADLCYIIKEAIINHLKSRLK